MAIVTAPSICCIITFMSVVLLVLLPFQAHCVPVVYIICDAKDSIGVENLDVIPYPFGQFGQPMNITIKFHDGFEGGANLSLSTFLPSGEELLESFTYTGWYQNELSLTVHINWKDNIDSKLATTVIKEIIGGVHGNNQRVCIRFPYSYI